MSSMESFEVLGTSPMSSVEDDEKPTVSILKEDASQSPKCSSINSNAEESIQIIKREEIDSLATISAKDASLIKINQMSNTISSNDTADVGGEASLDADFDFGLEDAEILQTMSLFSQLSSSSNVESVKSAEPTFQKLMTGVIEMKNSVTKHNAVIKELYDEKRKWQDITDRMEEQYKQQLSECHAEINALRNENLRIKKENEIKNELIKFYEDVRKTESWSAQISELETKLSTLTTSISHNESNNTANSIDAVEHQRSVQQFEDKIKALLIENEELKDMKTQYIEELTALKVSLTAAAEYLKLSGVDIECKTVKKL